MTNVDCVNNWVKGRNTSDLVFVRYYSGEAGEIEFNDFTEDGDSLIVSCLKLSKVLYSAIKSKDGFYYTETPPGRRRSVLDIWRHAKYINPNIDIFYVMRELYSIMERGEGKTNSLVCNGIGRRVFRYTGLMSRNYSPDERDEFGLLFNQWENIGNESTTEI